MMTTMTSFCYVAYLISFFCLFPTEAIPPGFREEPVARISDMSTIAFLPNFVDGETSHILVAAVKKGLVELVLDPNDTNQDDSATILDISDRVCNNGERGLHQILAHPDFLNNRYVYISYTYDKRGGCDLDARTGPVNRLSRFTMGDDYVIEEASEQVFLESEPLFNKMHNGGDMLFGNDGYLYLTMGDGGTRDSTALDLSSLYGTIIRLTDNGEIPPDNPFVDDGELTGRCNQGSLSDGKICQEIFAYGFRNPYRFALNPNTPKNITQLFVLDVGGKVWEEISLAGTGFEGANYGWSIREGPCEIDSDENCDLTDEQIVELTDPIYWYPHDAEGSGCVTGGAFVPNGLWPDIYDDAFLFTDFVFNEMYALKYNETAACSRENCTPPVPAWTNTTFHDLLDTENARPVQMVFGPYQDTLALYYTTREGNMNIRRVVFDGSDNQAPQAVIEVNQTQGPVGLVLMFDGRNSSDPDGDYISYLWDFGDGKLSTAPTRSHTFDTPGNFKVRLTVTDEMGYSSTSEVAIDIGTLPIPTIESPEENTTFAVGDVLTLVGSAVDGEGNPLSDMALTWEVRQHHNTHFHPFLDPTLGNSFMIDPAPSPEEFLAATNSYLEIVLTATDSVGLSGTTSRNVMPRIVLLSFETIPDGLQILLDGYMLTTPVTVASWENHPLEVAALDQNDLLFQDWSDGGASMHTIIVGANTDAEGGDTFTARFSASMPPSAYPTMSSTTPSPVAPTRRPTSSPSGNPATFPNSNPTAPPVYNPTLKPFSWPTISPSRGSTNTTSSNAEGMSNNGNDDEQPVNHKYVVYALAGLLGATYALIFCVFQERIIRSCKACMAKTRVGGQPAASEDNSHDHDDIPSTVEEQKPAAAEESGPPSPKESATFESANLSMCSM